MFDSIEQMGDISNELERIAHAITLPEQGPAHRERLAQDLKELRTKLNALIVPASYSMEAFAPALDTGNGRGGVLSFMDLTYNAFMIGRNMENREGSGRCDWFNDTHPLMVAGIEQIKRQCEERMAGAAETEARRKKVAA